MTNYYKFLTEEVPPGADVPGNGRFLFNHVLRGGTIWIDLNNMIIHTPQGKKPIPIVQDKDGRIIMIRPNQNVHIGTQTITFRMPTKNGVPVHDIHWVVIHDSKDDSTTVDPVVSGIHPNFPDLDEKDLTLVVEILLGVVAGKGAASDGGSNPVLPTQPVIPTGGGGGPVPVFAPVPPDI